MLQSFGTLISHLDDRKHVAEKISHTKKCIRDAQYAQKAVGNASTAHAR
jgi:hypothetical protein